MGDSSIAKPFRGLAIGHKMARPVFLWISNKVFSTRKFLVPPKEPRAPQHLKPYYPKAFEGCGNLRKEKEIIFDFQKKQKNKFL
jgi:hypothetical protein